MNALLDYQPADALLSDRVVLITGAASGIGRAVARAAASAGATTILVDKRLPELETLYDELIAQGAAQPVLCPMNLETAGWKDYEEIVASISQQFGRLDGLLLGAAHFETLTPIVDHSPETWMQILQVNLTSVFALTQLCLPLLLKSSSASVIAISDAVAQVPQPFWGAYAATKSATDTMITMLHMENDRHPIRFNSIDPGPVHTRLRQLAYPAASRESARQPEEVVGAFLYLLGDDSADVRGQRLRIEAPA